MKKGRYTIGEISRLCNISISKLRYLDKRCCGAWIWIAWPLCLTDTLKRCNAKSHRCKCSATALPPGAA